MKKTMLALALALWSLELPALSTTSYYAASAFDPQQRESVPRVEDLQFKLEFPPELAQVDAKSFDNDLNYEAASAKKIYYFTREGRELNAPGPWPFQQPAQLLPSLLGDGMPRPAPSPQPGGYYREILGKASDGSPVAQDFYQDSGNVQTAPFLLRPGYEADFSSDGNNGRVVRFNPDGQVIDVGNFKDGQLQGWLMRVADGQYVEAYSPENGLLLLLDRAGRPRVAMSQANGRVTYYYSNGAAMLQIDGSDEQAWDRDGREISTQQLDPQLLREAVGRVERLWQREKVDVEELLAGEKADGRPASEPPPAADELIKDIPTDLLTIDPLTYKNELDFQPLADGASYYFAKDGSEGPAEGSYYYRKIIGTTTDGKTVAQDFYSSGREGDKRPQTAPFIVRAGHERDFSSGSAEGRMIWYTEEENPRVDSMAHFRDGKTEGWQFIFRDGKLFFATDSDDRGDLLGFQDDKVALYLAKQVMVYYYEDGKPLARSEGEAVQIWDRQGRERENALDLELFRRRILLLRDILDYLKERNGAEGLSEEESSAKAPDSDGPRQLRDFFDGEFPSEGAAVPDYEPAAREEIYYFDGRGQPSATPQPDGYQRKIIGTRDGWKIAQDFYGDGTRQSSPFTLMLGEERNFTPASVAEGLVASYGRNGQLRHMANYRNGVVQGWQYLFKDGKPFLARRGRDYLLVDAAGPVAYFDGRTNHYHLFYPDGLERTELDFTGQPRRPWNVARWSEDDFKKLVVQPLMDYFNNREEP